MTNTKKEKLKKKLDELKDSNDKDYKNLLKEWCSKLNINKTDCSLDSLVEKLIKPAYSEKFDEILKELDFIVGMRKLQDYVENNNNQGLSL